jgi:hypothetical protein
MHQIEGLEQGRGHGHAPVDARAAFLQALKHQHAGGEVDAVHRQRQRLGQPTAAGGECHAQRAHRAIDPLGGAQEGVALFGGEVFAGARGGVQLHTSLWRRLAGLGGCFPG